MLSLVPKPILESLTRAGFWWGLFACWAAGIVVLSSLSTVSMPPIESRFFEIDKLVHAAAFCVGALFLTPAVRLQFDWPAPTTGGLSLYAMFLYGVVDEMHQTFVPNRTGMDAGDLTADLIGAALGVGLALLIYGGIQTRQSRPSLR